MLVENYRYIEKTDTEQNVVIVGICPLESFSNENETFPEPLRCLGVPIGLIHRPSNTQDTIQNEFMDMEMKTNEPINEELFNHLYSSMEKEDGEPKHTMTRRHHTKKTSKKTRTKN